jgi:hypothetical protein
MPKIHLLSPAAAEKANKRAGLCVRVPHGNSQLGWNAVTAEVATEFGWVPPKKVGADTTRKVLNNVIISNPEQWEHTHYRLQDVIACIAGPWEPVRVTEEFKDHVPTGRLFPARIGDEIKYALLMRRHQGAEVPFEITVQNF